MTLADLVKVLSEVNNAEKLQRESIPFIKHKKNLDSNSLMLHEDELLESDSFKQDFVDENIVAMPKLFCFGSSPVTKLSQIATYGGGKKQSCLCGFRFESKFNTKNPNFQIVYVPKLQSKKYQRKSAQFATWQAWTINGNTINVMSIEQLLKEYDFDFLEFVETDLFKNAVSRFKSCVERGLADANKLMVELDTTLTTNTISNYIKTIQKGIDTIDNIGSNINDKSWTMTIYDEN